MKQRIWLVIASLGGFSGVALGAFGAHALRGRLAETALAAYHTAVEYQLWHSLALLGVALLLELRTGRLLGLAACSFALGILLFSGSLYLLALTGVRGFGAITPLGGLAWLLGWACLGLWAWRRPADRPENQP